MGKLSRRATIDLSIVLEGTCHGAQGPTKQRASANYCATRSTASSIPVRVGQPADRGMASKLLM